MINKQKQLFENIIKLKYKLQSLGSFVQNDFSRMLDDGTATKEAMIESILDLNGAYDIVIDDLNKYRKQSEEIITHYINHYNVGDLTKELISEIEKENFELLTEKEKNDIEVFRKMIEWQNDFSDTEWYKFNNNMYFCPNCNAYCEYPCDCYTR